MVQLRRRGGAVLASRDGMKDEKKTKAKLISELAELRHRVAEMETRQMEPVSAQGALLESASAAIIIVDTGGRIVLANAGAEAMFGYTREELIGQPLERLLPPRSAEVHAGHRNAFFANPRV